METNLTNKANPMDAAATETVLIGGDLSMLSPRQRVSYYQATCKSLGLNPLTKPFDYINLNGRLTLYARKDAADQLRNLRGISIGKVDIQYIDEYIVVTVIASDAHGRTDSDVGVVKKSDMRGDFGNALMKAVTKAKRRVTLSICGLGWLDETEIDTIPEARQVEVKETGEIVEDADTSWSDEAYSDGTPVGPKPEERTAFRQYVVQHGGKKPDNIHNLRAWVKNQQN